MRPCGFTLVELMVVVVMVSLLAAVVSPGLGAIRETQRDAGYGEVHRMLRIAQQYARASGRPHGLWLNATEDWCTLVSFEKNTEVAPALDGLGTAVERRWLSDDFAGLDLNSVDPGEGTPTGEAVLWFDYRGHPEIRDLDGSNRRAPSTDPIVEFAGLTSIQLDRLTGVVR